MQISGAEAFKGATRCLLPAEELQDGDAGQGFRQKTVEFCQLAAYGAEALPRQLGKKDGDDEGNRNENRHQGRQSRVHPEQQHEDAEQSQQVIEEGDDDRGEHFIHVLDIVGQPGYQLAGATGVEKRQIEMQKMVEKTLPDAVHHPLSHPLKYEDLAEGGKKHADDNAAVKQGISGKSGQFSRSTGSWLAVMKWSMAVCTR